MLPPKHLVDPLSYWLARWLARSMTPSVLVCWRNAAIAVAIVALEQVPEVDQACRAPFYGEGYYTIVDLFRTPAQHFAAHTAGLDTELTQVQDAEL